MSTPAELSARLGFYLDGNIIRDTNGGGCHPANPYECSLFETIDSLQAQVEVLRGALDLVVQHDPTTPGLSFDSHLQLLESAVGIARAALTQSSDAEMGEKT